MLNISYSPNLGRWITADPQGFDDGPNLYAYVHNSPFTTLDLHGLFSWWNTWTGMKNFGVGVGRHSWGMARGVGRSFISTSEWMGADALYEMGERSHFHAKSRASYEGWKSFGSALYNDPIGTGGEMLVPGLMEAFRNPTSAESWGSAAVDIALIGVSVAKFGQATRFANAGRIGEEAAAFGRAGRAAEQVVAAERFLIPKGTANQIWSSTKKRTSVQNAYRHWKDHGHEFPSLQNSKQYVEATREFIHNSSPSTLTKIRLNGDVVFYDPSSNTFAVTNQYNIPRTMYRPDHSIHNYQTNL